MKREAYGREPRNHVRMSALDRGTIAAAERAEEKREPSCADLAHLPVPFLIAGGDALRVHNAAHSGWASFTGAYEWAR